VQFEFAGALAVPDGRYLARDGEGDEGQRVLVVETIGAPAATASRRRRRSKAVEPGGEPAPLPLTRITAVRAQAPFDAEADATAWLEETLAATDLADAALVDAIGLLNKALHAQAAASADPRAGALDAGEAAKVRIGYGSGEQVADGRFAAAHELDLGDRRSRRRQREEALRPQERLAAVLGGRERIDACETMILRARADLDGDRFREAALQLRVGLEAMLVELDGALTDPGHDEDMATLRQRRGEAGEAANEALHRSLDVERERQVRELTEICERVLRRRRVLRG
jgi:hypothetical protein